MYILVWHDYHDYIDKKSIWKNIYISMMGEQKDIG